MEFTQTNSASSSQNAIVIGAGMAGVTAARALTRAGLRVLILEARRRLADASTRYAIFAVHRSKRVQNSSTEERRRLRPDVRDGKSWRATQPSQTRRDDERRRWGALAARCFGKPRGVAERTASCASWLTPHPNTMTFTAAQFIKRQGYRGQLRACGDGPLLPHLPGDLEHGIHGFVADGVLSSRQATTTASAPDTIAWSSTLLRGSRLNMVSW